MFLDGEWANDSNQDSHRKLPSSWGLLLFESFDDAMYRNQTPLEDHRTRTKTNQYPVPNQDPVKPEPVEPDYS